MIRLALLSLALVAVAACAGQSPPDASSPSSSAADAEQASACKAKGGIYDDPGSGFTCILSYEDGQKDCTDGSQCQSGQCLADAAISNRRQDGSDHGQCWPHSTLPGGCFVLIKDGTSGDPVCK